MSQEEQDRRCASVWSSPIRTSDELKAHSSILRDFLFCQRKNLGVRCADRPGHSGRMPLGFDTARRNRPNAPLTPALSPLRGEGERYAAYLVLLETGGAVPLSPQRGEGRGGGCEWPIAS